MERYLLGCDWGTSSFRMRLFDISAQHAIAEATSEEGIASMHKSWQNLDRLNTSITKVDFFRDYLKKEIDVLSDQYSLNLGDVTIVISGMASSSIGMKDVPYATLPFALDGSDTAIKLLPRDNTFPHEIILISGVRIENDVMRGEETQLIGLLALLEQSDRKLKEGILIFPGTHSKHIHISNDRLIKFHTFMTGELFDLVSNHSVLKDSIQKDEANKLSEASADAFKLGVQKSKEFGILNRLFTVRTNQLFDKLDKIQNTFYLSGLLIGEEMSYLLKDDKVPLALCSASNLATFYKLAIEELNLSERTTIISADLVDKAALAGQYLIFQKHILNKQVQ